jgi:ubiquinol-cytochrome c reductase cytochrome c1 subunit
MIAETDFMTILKAIAVAALTLGSLPSLGFASEGQKTAKDVSYSFDGAFGTFDRAQLQRGFKVYKEVCSNCHSMKLLSFRNLAEGKIFTEEQVKALAATYSVKDEPDANGEIKDRPARPSDRFPSVYDNVEAAKAANGGVVPPDMSLLAKSRPGWYGTVNQFWNGIGGPQYIYSVVTGYEEPEGELAKEQPEGKYYNPYFGSGHWIGMPPPLAEGQVVFDDGAPNGVNDMAKDVSAFLAFAADPNMESRKSTGFMVMLYLAALAVLMYFVKKRVWADLH